VDPKHYHEAINLVKKNDKWPEEVYKLELKECIKTLEAGKKYKPKKR
jgi:hypothetical protein